MIHKGSNFQIDHHRTSLLIGLFSIIFSASKQKKNKKKENKNKVIFSYCGFADVGQCYFEGAITT